MTRDSVVQQVADASMPYGLEILTILEQQPQRSFDRGRVQFFAIQRDERRDPVESFGNAGHLVELDCPKLLHKRCHLAGESGSSLRRLSHYNPQFFVEVGIVD